MIWSRLTIVVIICVYKYTYTNIFYSFTLLAQSFLVKLKCFIFNCHYLRKPELIQNKHLTNLFH